MDRLCRACIYLAGQAKSDSPEPFINLGLDPAVDIASHPAHSLPKRNVSCLPVRTAALICINHILEISSLNSFSTSKITLLLTLF